MFESKLLEELFLVNVWKNFRKGGGGSLIQNFYRNFSACVWNFFQDELIFCFGLDIFQGKRGSMVKIQTPLGTLII